jgi:hypothetical protein
VSPHYNSNITTHKDVNEGVLIDLEGKTDTITRSLSRPYYNKILKNLLKTNPTNAK